MLFQLIIFYSVLNYHTTVYITQMTKRCLFQLIIIHFYSVIRSLWVVLTTDWLLMLCSVWIMLVM